MVENKRLPIWGGEVGLGRQRTIQGQGTQGGKPLFGGGLATRERHPPGVKVRCPGEKKRQNEVLKMAASNGSVITKENLKKQIRG